MGKKANDKLGRTRHDNSFEFLDERIYLRPENIPSKPRHPLAVAFQSALAPKISTIRKLTEKASAAYFSIAGSALDMLRSERDAGNVLALGVLSFSTGICSYFLGQYEPNIIVTSISCIILAAICMRMRDHGAVWVFTCLLMMFVAGLAIGNIRTNFINPSTLSHQLTGKTSGTIIEVTLNTRGAPRYEIVVTNVEGLSPNNTPKLLRLSAHSKHEKGRPGDGITGLARMQPVTGPVYPGGYDFSFNHWFRGLGGTGFFMGAPKIEKKALPSGEISFLHKFSIEINRIRENIASRIRAAISGEKADVAVALITGDRSGISKATQQSLRNSGLAHVLAISGMHMALVSLTFIWSVRFLLSLNQKLVQSVAIKNWAAFAGFIVATSYLTISGLSVATQRAWIMISVVLLATLVNRKALTLRSVLIAALIVLIIQPESILSPGFQMSFAAVAAIIAAWEWHDQKFERIRQSGFFNKTIRFIGTLAFTSLIAGLATSIIAAWHFQQFAVLGVITNLLAMPIVSLAIMPLALLGVLLMPYGLEHFIFVGMGSAIEMVIWISALVNQLGDVHITGKLGLAVLPLTGIAIYFITIFTTKLRFAALLPLLVIPFFWKGPEPPDILLAEDGRAIAIKTAAGMSLLYPRRSKFVTDIWKKSWPDHWADTIGKKNEKLPNCDKDKCIKNLTTGASLHVIYDPKLLKSACKSADILLAPRLRWVNCYGKKKPTLIVKRGDLEEYGSHSIYLSDKSNDDETVAAGEKTTLQQTKQSQTKMDAQAAKADATTGFRIERVVTAFTHSSRPWLARREGRAQYLQD